MRLFRPSAATVLVLLAMAPTAVQADWPEYRGNQQRTAYRDQRLPPHWSPAWCSKALAPPTPAWPAPARGSLWQKLESVEPRVTDDRGYVPLLATDTRQSQHLLIASSTSDRLLSLDPQTGRVRWQYWADGPIRYAPSVHQGVVYFGADDGLVRALDLASGSVLWSTQIGPVLPLVVGNGRLISPYPIRTSVTATGEAVFANAGLFPSQGVYSVALDPQDGRPLWRRRTQKSPQGYLLTDQQQRLVIPCGRATPYLVERATGRFVSDCQSQGGTFAMVTADAFFSGPGNVNQVQSYANLPESKMLPLAGRAIAAGGGRLWSADGRTVRCFDLKRLVTHQENAEIWQLPTTANAELIVSGDLDARYLFAAEQNQIQILNAVTGAERPSLSIPEQDTIRHIAVSSADGDQPAILVATTAEGHIYCWRGADTPATSTATVLWPAMASGGDAPSADPPVANAPVSNAPLAQAPEPGPSAPQPLVSPPQTANVSPITREQIKQAVSRLPSPRGFALLLDDDDGACASELLQSGELHLVSVVEDPQHQNRLRSKFLADGVYGQRICVLHVPSDASLPFSRRIFNLVVQAQTSDRPTAALSNLLDTGSGILVQPGKSPRTAAEIPAAGVWRHLYGNPANTADSGDIAFADANTFRLNWFGGVGPARIPDRHLRAHAPLAAGSSLILHGDDYLIGVDPANGTERWQKRLPLDATRYVIPLDCGYSCLSRDGKVLYTATADEILQLDAYSGAQTSAVKLPADLTSLRWGYLAEADGQLFASCMKRTAPRLKIDATTKAGAAESETEPPRLSRATIRDQFVDKDYESGRPLVCSRLLMNLAPASGPQWRYSSVGVIPNSSVSLAAGQRQMVFVEGRSPQCQSHPTDRIPVALIARDAWLVCIDTTSGQRLWERPLTWDRAQNMLYTQIADDKVIVSTSSSVEKQGASYDLQVFQLTDGADLWSQQHAHVTDGLGHGEQIHHPLVLRQSSGQLCLFAEPYLYALADGRRVSPGGESDWALRRPGHSCGTISGAGDCVFFRASNPTVLSLSSGATKADRFQKLSPSRPSCWINMLPVAGRLLIPEGSASCVCQYPLQTSMAFVPTTAGELPLLPDFPQLKDTEPAEIHRWQFADADGGTVVSPVTGSLPLQAAFDVAAESDGIALNGGQWLAVAAAQTPRLPETISLEAELTVASGNHKWTGIVGAIQDNGDFERGSLLGIHESRFFLAIAAEGKSRLTYLEASETLEFDRSYHVLGTYDGSLMRLYVDGRLVAVSSAQSGPILQDADSLLTVGIYKDRNDHFPMKGTITSVAIYRGALSADEVRSRGKD